MAGIIENPNAPFELEEDNYTQSQDHMQTVDFTDNPMVGSGNAMVDTAMRNSDRTFDTDLQQLEGIGDGIKQTGTTKPIFNSTDRPDYWRGRYAQHLVREKGFTKDEAFEMLEVDDESKDILDKNMFTKAMYGFVADYKMTAYGIGKLTGIRDDNATEQTERIDFVRKYNESHEFMKGFDTSYDEDGSPDEPWSFSAGLGEAGPAILSGGLGGAAIKQPIKLMAAGMINESIMQTAQYQLHKDPTRLAVGIGSSLLGEAAGAYIGSKFAKSLSKGTTKTIQETERQLKGLQWLEETAGLPITSDMLNDPKGFEALIQRTAANGYEADRMKKIFSELKIDMINGIDDMARTVGTDPISLMQYRNGTKSANEMGTKFNKWLGDQKASYRAKENVLYNEAKTLDVNDQGVQNTYDITPLMDDILKATETSREARAVVLNELKHIAKSESSESLKRRATLDLASKALTNIDIKVPKLEAHVSKAQQKMVVLKLRRSEFTDTTPDSVIMKNLQDLKNTQNTITANTDKISRYNKQRPGYVTTINKWYDWANKLTPTDEVGDVVSYQLTANQLKTAVSRMNEKLNVPGGIFNLNDSKQVASLERVKKLTKKFMHNNIKNTKFMELNDAADKIAAERFGLMGKQSPIQGISEALKSSDPADMFNLFTGKHGISNLEHLGKLKGTNDPVYKEMANKVVYDKMMDGVRIDTAPGANIDMSFKQLAKNINADEFIDDVARIAGKETAEIVDGLRYIVNTFAQPLESVLDAEVAAGKKGILKGIQTMIKDIHELGREATVGLNPKLDKATQDLPLVGNNRWYQKQSDLSALVKAAKSELAAAKSGKRKLAIGEQLGRSIGKILEGEPGKQLSGSIIREGATTITGGVVGGTVGYEVGGAEGAVVGALIGAGLGVSASKGIGGYKPGRASMLGDYQYAASIGKEDSFIAAEKMMKQGDSPESIERATGMVTTPNGVRVPIPDFLDRLDLSPLQGPYDSVRGPRDIQFSELVKDSNDPILNLPGMDDVTISTDYDLGGNTLGTYQSYGAQIKVANLGKDTSIPHELTHHVQDTIDSAGKGASPSGFTRATEVDTVRDFLFEAIGFKPPEEAGAAKYEVNRLMDRILENTSARDISDIKGSGVKKFITRMALNSNSTEKEIKEFLTDMLPYNRYYRDKGEIEARMSKNVSQGKKVTYENLDPKSPITKLYEEKYSLQKPDTIIGDVDTTAYTMKNESEQTIRSVHRALMDKSIHSTRTLRQSDRQALVNSLFSSREMGRAKGMSGNQSKTDAKYFGKTGTMNPTQFLKLASKRSKLVDVDKGKDFVKNLKDQWQNPDSKAPRLGPPILYLKEVDGKLKVTGHEGRHRTDAVWVLAGDDVQIPVDIYINNVRAHSIDKDMYNKEVISQDGRKTGLTYGDLINKPKELSSQEKRWGQDFSGRNIQSEGFSRAIADNKGEFSGTVYRGLKDGKKFVLPKNRGPDYKQGNILDEFKAANIGDIIPSKSTHVDAWGETEGLADFYAKDSGIILKTKVTDGLTNRDIGAMDHTGNTQEVYSLNSDMKVINKYTNKQGKTVIEVEYINQQDALSQIKRNYK